MQLSRLGSFILKLVKKLGKALHLGCPMTHSYVQIMALVSSFSLTDKRQSLYYIFITFVLQ